MTGENENRILFDTLLEVCDGALETQKAQLAKDISKIQVKEREGWKRMTSYREVNMKGAAVRQDSIIDEKTNTNLIKHPVIPSFKESELRNLGILETYDTSAHLANLSVIAHAINERFHESVRSIFEIDKTTGISENGAILYRAGPLKDLGRCKSKTEDDYFDARFPTSSNLLDIVRGSLVFSSCKDCVEGLEKLEEAVGLKKTHIKEIGRVKNTLRRFCVAFSPYTTYSRMLSLKNSGFYKNCKTGKQLIRTRT